MKWLFLYTLICLIVSSCASHDELLDYALEAAADNRPELEKVLAHYADEPQKLEASSWLIANMPGHVTTGSEAIQRFADSVNCRQIPYAEARQLWDSLQRHSGNPVKQRDIESLSFRFLADNIDGAFRAWEDSPWRDEVDFDLFKRFVLPYRADHELVRIGWRDSLRNLYAPVVDGTTSAKEAFERLKQVVTQSGRADRYDDFFPYLMDCVALRNHCSGVCLERCVFLTGLCRAFGLPVVIDNCGKWANYSDNTHSWVALVLNDGTYTIADEELEAKKFNAIDASRFVVNQPMPDYYTYSPEFRKRLVKVWRQTYFLNRFDREAALYGASASRLASPHLIDVSDQYGLNHSVAFDTPDNVTDVWLCTHSLSSGWIPQAHAHTDNGKTTFNNLADSVMLLPMGMSDSGVVPVGNPFFLDINGIHKVIPDSTHLETATITRKYPVISKWPNRHSQIIGTTFSGSLRHDFATSDTLAVINQVPVYHNVYNVSSAGKYHYIRLNPGHQDYVNKDRIVIYDKSGDVLKDTICDNIDLGVAYHIGKIEYFPWNDGNYVRPGHEYELVCWKHNQWQPISHQYSNGYGLTFDNIPHGALLLLHDLTEGKEERPFTLKDGKQVWW